MQDTTSSANQYGLDGFALHREFLQHTRFTKEGVLGLTEHIDGFLKSESNRGCPLTPLNQVVE